MNGHNTADRSNAQSERERDPITFRHGEVDEAHAKARVWIDSMKTEQIRRG